MDKNCGLMRGKFVTALAAGSTASLLDTSMARDLHKCNGKGDGGEENVDASD